MKRYDKSLSELFDIASEDMKPLFFNFNKFNINDFPFLESYKTESYYIDERLCSKYGSRVYSFIRPNARLIQNEAEYVEDFTEVFYNWLVVNKSNLTRMWDTINAEYNALNNYDKTSTIRTTYNGSEMVSDTKESTDSTNSSNELTKSGSEFNTKSGSETTTKSGSEINAKSGAEISNELVSPQTNSITKSKSSFDSNDLVVESEENENVGAITKNASNSFNNRSDTLSFNERKDILSFDDVENILSFDNRKDINISSSTNSNNASSNNVKEFIERYDEVTEHTQGNIGVTTSDQLLKSFIDLRWTLDFTINVLERFIFEYTY